MKIKSLLKPKKTNLLNFKVTDSELQLIKKKADEFTDGNVSEWIRYATIKLSPPKSDRVADAKAV